VSALDTLGQRLRASLRDWLQAEPSSDGSTHLERVRSGWSDGRKALELISTQQEWTHRRVETYSLEEHGETRQRISWDFTIDQSLAIPASRGRTAVPLATMRKQSLKRLDVTDASGAALSVWGRDDNGGLAQAALTSYLTGLLGRDLTDREGLTLHRIVFATDAEAAYPELQRLSRTLSEAGDGGASLMAIASDLAANFLLVVEVPNDCVGSRSLVKLQHEGDIGQGEQFNALATVHGYRFEGAAWSSVASWHVEIHATPGLAIAGLTARVSDTDDRGELVTREVLISPATGPTAHISGEKTPLGSLSFADLELRPAAGGLVNQTVTGAIVASLLLGAGCIWTDRLFEAIQEADRAAAVAAVMLAVPAVLIAFVARGPEHPLVSRLLLAPRLVNFAVATVLLATAAALVLGLDQRYFEWTLRALLVGQLVLLAVAIGIRIRAVGGRT
jgi:hypothetical protein